MEKKLVNWTNMMNLSPEVFVQTEDYFIELISRSLACGIGNNKYGLLPPSQIKESSSDIRIQEKLPDRSKFACKSAMR